MADKVHFRCRGYSCDEETGCCYLQSRYYGPSICRFIRADRYELLPELSDSLGELNLYAYCANNPIMHTDPSGEPIFTIIFILVTTSLIGTGIGIKHAYDTGKEGWGFVKDVIIGFGLGLAAGGLIVSGWAAIKGSLAVLGWISNATVWGVEAQKAFAIGLLAYDFTAIIIAPVVGLELEPIDMGDDKPYQFPKPEETPKHPFLKRHRRSGTLFGFSMNGII